MTVSNDGAIMASNGGHSDRRNDEIEFEDDGVVGRVTSSQPSAMWKLTWTGGLAYACTYGHTTMCGPGVVNFISLLDRNHCNDMLLG